MVIRLDENYNAMTSTALLGYVGETNARPVSVEGLTVDGADRYVLTIDYGDGTVYEVDITGGQWTPTADILRSAQTVSCQIAAKKLSGDEYVLVKKSRIFRLRIGAAIGDTAIPSPDVAMDALDRIDAIGRQAHADMQTAVTAAETATTMANNAAKSATPTAYAPFHRNEYPIPEAIRALPGYGVEGNAVDYEAKTYTQNNAIDGTKIKALDTPIITDISTLIDDDFLRNLTVEAGGSVTFKNSNGDSYRIPVPSEEEYIVKLSEIGGTT